MKTIVLGILACGACFYAGWFTSQKVNNVEFLEEANDFKYEVLGIQHEALLRVDTIMDRNNIYDMDGSDTMYEYLELRCKIDSLYNTQN